MLKETMMQILANNNTRPIEVVIKNSDRCDRVSNLVDLLDLAHACLLENTNLADTGRGVLRYLIRLASAEFDQHDLCQKVIEKIESYDNKKRTVVRLQEIYSSSSQYSDLLLEIYDNSGRFRVTIINYIVMVLLLKKQVSKA